MNDFNKEPDKWEVEGIDSWHPMRIEEDGWEILTRILAFVLCVLGILLILNWK